jgi:hypothetical protein
VAPSAIISRDLTGTNATGALNILNFDNEPVEPSGPPSRDDTNSGSANSHGFAYFQYKYDAANPDEFNDQANELDPEDSDWSIIISTHVTKDVAYYQALLAKAGAVSYNGLSTTTAVEHTNAGAFNLGPLTYDSNLLNGVGTEILNTSQFGLTLTKNDYNFNALNESTAPGTWGPYGYPYYYWGIDSYSFVLSNFSGQGLTFVDGQLTSLDFTADVSITHPLAGGKTWDGTLTFAGNQFTFDINELESIAFGDLRMIMDRTGTIDLVPEPSAVFLGILGGIIFISRRRKRVN